MFELEHLKSHWLKEIQRAESPDEESADAEEAAERGTKPLLGKSYSDLAAAEAMEKLEFR